MSEFENGKTYKISHRRKGNMTIKITDNCHNGEFVDCIIIDGYAKAVGGGAQAQEGDPFTFRAGLATILEEVA